jgi:hypothetical protein
VIADESFKVEYIDPVMRPAFFRIRETKQYGRVWGLTEEEAVELYYALGDALKKLDD